MSMEMLGLPGLIQLRTGVTGQRARPPLGHLMGFRLGEVSTGNVAMRMPLSPWLRGPSGRISLGALAIPSDVALGGTVGTILPPATIMATSELSLRQLAPAPADGDVIVRSHLVYAHGSTGLSEATLTDATGRLLAHGTSQCFIPPPFSPAPEPPADLPPFEPPAYGTPDPWARELDADLPGAPIGHLVGIRPVSEGDGTATFALTTSEWLSIMRGVVNGGVIALLAELALTAAIRTAAPAAAAAAVVDLKVNYLRPLPADGNDATARATVVHTGRRRAIGNVEVSGADGKLVALATGSAMLTAE